jgi:hypothetical protein
VENYTREGSTRASNSRRHKNNLIAGIGTGDGRHANSLEYKPLRLVFITEKKIQKVKQMLACRGKIK